MGGRNWTSGDIKRAFFRGGFAREKETDKRHRDRHGDTLGFSGRRA